MTVLTEAAMMGADIDGDVLVYLDMAQVVCPVNMALKAFINYSAILFFINDKAFLGKNCSGG